MMKGEIQHEDITLVNVYAPNIGVPKYVKQILMDKEGETSGNTVIDRDFNTPFISMVDISVRKSVRRQQS